MPPCNHTTPRCTPGQPFNITTDCRLCWLATHDPGYAELWGEPVPDPEIVMPAYPAPNFVVQAQGNGGTECGTCGKVPEQPSEAAKAPGFIQRMLTYADDTAQWIAGGSIKVSLEIYAERKRICESNECKLYDAAKKQCLGCGCYLGPTILGDKWERNSASCPVGKWEAIV